VLREESYNPHREKELIKIIFGFEHHVQKATLSKAPTLVGENDLADPKLSVQIHQH